MIARAYDGVLRFVIRHERPLASVLFVFGFVTDILTFGFLELETVTLLFAAYVLCAVGATLVAHATYKKADRGLVYGLSVLMPLVAQFTFGSILSGFVIFYTKSAVLSISWPFIILLLIIFFGNEVFRNYRSHLIFQTVLVYFSFYAFAVFALPLYLGRIGTTVFLEATAATILVFGIYVWLLHVIDWRRLRLVVRSVLVSTLVVTILIVASYLTGVLPPIPLTLKAGGIYQSIERVDGGYVAQGEGIRPWYDPRPQVVHHTPGTPLYAYSAIFAPGSFSTSVVHVWQRYDTAQHSWVTESTVAFSLSGGRAGGYRGYTLKYDPAPGKWRVLVQTLNGQTIGDFRFTVINTPSLPSLKEVTL